MKRGLTRLLMIALGVTLLVTPGCKDSKASIDELPPDEQARELSEGYSVLHQIAGKLASLDMATLLKSENDAVADLVEDVSDAAAGLRDGLETIAGNDPDIALGLEPMPKMLVAMQARIESRQKALLKPTGATGMKFEKALLTAAQSGLMQMRYLLDALRDNETDDGRQEKLTKHYDRIKRLHGIVTDVLERRHGCG